MSEILSREFYEHLLSNAFDTGNEARLLAHDAALRSALAAAGRELADITARVDAAIGPDLLSGTRLENRVFYITDKLAREQRLREIAERERDEARASEEWLAFASMREERDALKAERNAALTLAENRGAAYDMTWREVESLRDRLDKEEEERGRQFGLRVQAEAEVERLAGLVEEWLDGNARLGRPKSIADQRFLNGLNAAIRSTFSHWSGTATKPEE